MNNGVFEGNVMKTAFSQRGVSISGLLMASALLIFALLTIMKLFPLYNQSFKIEAAMKSVANQPPSSRRSAGAIYRLLLRNFEVTDMDNFTPQNIKKYASVKKVKGSKDKMLTFVYEARGPLFGSLDAVLKIDKSTLMEAGATPDS